MYRTGTIMKLSLLDSDNISAETGQEISELIEAQHCTIMIV